MREGTSIWRDQGDVGQEGTTENALLRTKARWYYPKVETEKQYENEGV